VWKFISFHFIGEDQKQKKLFLKQPVIDDWLAQCHAWIDDQRAYLLVFSPLAASRCRPSRPSTITHDLPTTMLAGPSGSDRG
jgi:hypothetical protein